MPRYTSTELIELIKRDGWIHASTRGDHHQFTHPEKPGRTTIPHPKKDLPVGTIQSILKQAGLK